MSDVQQIGQDLQFVRSAVTRGERENFGPPLILYVWALYVMVGYTLIDFRPQYSGPFLAIGGIVGGIVSWMIGRSYARKIGQSDMAMAIKALLHFGGGIMLCVAFAIGLSEMAAPLRPYSGQLIVGPIGLLYFLCGVHYQRYFLFLGVVVMAGGVLVGLVPHFGWTILGAVIALGLILPTLVPAARPPTQPHDSAATPEVTA